MAMGHVDENFDYKDFNFIVGKQKSMQVKALNKGNKNGISRSPS